MEPNKQMIGIVIRKDGTVPFDDDCPHEVRAHILAHLTDQGHHYEPVEGCRHVRIKNWKPPHPQDGPGKHADPKQSGEPS